MEPNLTHECLPMGDILCHSLTTAGNARTFEDLARRHERSGQKPRDAHQQHQSFYLAQYPHATP